MFWSHLVLGRIGSEHLSGANAVPAALPCLQLCPLEGASHCSQLKLQHHWDSLGRLCTAEGEGKKCHLKQKPSSKHCRVWCATRFSQILDRRLFKKSSAAAARGRVGHCLCFDKPWAAFVCLIALDDKVMFTPLNFWPLWPLETNLPPFMVHFAPKISLLSVVQRDDMAEYKRGSHTCPSSHSLLPSLWWLSSICWLLWALNTVLSAYPT